MDSVPGPREGRCDRMAESGENVLEFDRCKNFIPNLETLVDAGEDAGQGKTITVVIPGEGLRDNLVDLYSISRFVLAIQAARVEGWTVRIQVRARVHSKGLVWASHSGLLWSLAQSGADLDFPLLRERDRSEISEQLISGEFENSTALRSNLSGAGDQDYVHALFPLQAVRFLPAEDEEATEREAQRVISGIAREVAGRLQGLGPQAKPLRLETDRLLYGLALDLISNVVKHSGTDTLFFGLTLGKRTSWSPRYFPPGFVSDPIQDRLELTVFDSGKGILPTVGEALFGSEWLERGLGGRYLKFSPFSYDEMEVTAQREKELLGNIFRGELLVRRGRRSEGLSEIANTLSWFGGLLSVFSGRTEVSLLAKDGESIISAFRPRHLQPRYFLHGTIASALVPSNACWTGVEKTEGGPGRSGRVDCSVKLIDPPRSVFWGGAVSVPIRRRAELFVDELTQSWVARAKKSQKPANQQDEGTHDDHLPLFLEIDFRGLADLEVEALDGLIQELVKSSYSRIGSAPRLLDRLVFTNVPRNIIRDLQQRNGQGFLALSGSVLVVFDELFQPHILGPPAVGVGSPNPLSRLLRQSLLFGGVSTRAVLESGGRSLIEDFGRIVEASGNSGIFRKTTKTLGVVRIRRALARRRAARLEELEKALVKEPLNAVYELRNGTYLDSLWHFESFWDDPGCLRDIAQLLSYLLSAGHVETLIGFMGNGARLCSEIQKYRKIPNLVFLDPYDPSSWPAGTGGERAVLVLDVLYPGDEERGYVRRLLEGGQDTEGGPSYLVEEVLCAVDARKDPPADIVCGVPLTCPRFPKVRKPSVVKVVEARQRVLRKGDYYRSVAPRESRELRASRVSEATRNGYSEIEKSVDFWQNVSQLGVLSSQSEGREKRNVVFFENNERLIRHLRLRRYVDRFLSAFAAQLPTPPTIILHPSHAVGETLAQWLADRLPGKTLVVPLRQTEYGGPIQIDQEEYVAIEQRVALHEETTGFTDRRVVLVDDSVLSGRSLFTMLGAAKKLQLQPIGFLVLLSRLTPEVSEALDARGVLFRYLYRLHMPVPDRKDPWHWLDSLNQGVVRTSNSSFAQLWGRRLSNLLHPGLSGGDMGGFIDMLVTGADEGECILSREGRVRVLSALPAQKEEERIVRELILHEDGRILNFSARIAITHNFLESLFRYSGFRSFLTACVEEACAGGNENAVAYLQAFLFYATYSRILDDYFLFGRFENLCESIIEESLQNEPSRRTARLLSFTLMSLGIVGSTIILAVAKRLLDRYQPVAFPGHGSTGPGILSEDVLKKRSDAREILGAFSWALGRVLAVKMPGMVDLETVRGLTRATPELDHIDIEREVVLIDLLSPFLRGSHLDQGLFGDGLEPEEWTGHPILDRLEGEEGEKGDLFQFLRDAPGYAGTLRSILDVTGAQTVFLYVKSPSDQEFFLRQMDTVGEPRRRNQAVPSSTHLSTSLPPFVQSRMIDQLPAASEDSDVCRVLDRVLDLEPGERFHKWFIGAPIQPPNQRMSYFVLLGFSQSTPPSMQVRDVYQRWLRMETHLREILPSLHEKFVEAASSWHALHHSMVTLHAPKKRSREPEALWERRKFVGLAARAFQAVEVPRHLDDMSSLPVVTLRSLTDQVAESLSTLHLELKNVLGEGMKDGGIGLGDDWPIIEPDQVARNPEALVPFSFHASVLRLVLSEVMKNALAHYHQTIRLALETIPEEAVRTDVSETIRDQFGDVGRIWVQFEVRNDIHPDFVPYVEGDTRAEGGRPWSSVGRSACETAAKVVRGYFEDEFSPMDGRKEWVSRLVMPGYRLPSDLRRIFL